MRIEAILIVVATAFSIQNAAMSLAMFFSTRKTDGYLALWAWVNGVILITLGALGGLLLASAMLSVAVWGNH